MSDYNQKSPWFWFYGIIALVMLPINFTLMCIGFIAGLSWTYFHGGFIYATGGNWIKKIKKPEGIRLGK